MARYKIARYGSSIILEYNEQGIQFRSFFAEGSQFSSEYQAWLAEGNVPDPPDPPPPPDDRPTLEERIVAAETLINLILDEEGV